MVKGVGVGSKNPTSTCSSRKYARVLALAKNFSSGCGLDCFAINCLDITSKAYMR